MDHTLFNLCLQFKTRVCTEMRTMPQISRDTLKGDYLFIIDNLPIFILLVDDNGAWSVLLKPKQKSSNIDDKNDFNSLDLYDVEIDSECPFPISHTQVFNIIETSSRCQIKTDGNTLKRLLLGTIRARVAFITQRVKISGDFPAFLKIISYLKTKGLKPNANTQSPY